MRERRHVSPPVVGWSRAGLMLVRLDGRPAALRRSARERKTINPRVPHPVLPPRNTAQHG
ncbi:hypothetical protein AORI_3772 [Amycolatopsis keratiniphila]|uniref:Uncharacterized protein n=1 Tax=Amycolatopsis keratiniphila TaxID=129921 RepID=R4T5R6_9PSEU|nr:hypothetical protein AORI_3772 [Amycolatopsis keratiniphila]